MGIRREYKPRGISLDDARERNLKALGKSAEWYAQKFQEQNGTCAICHEAETRIGLDGNVRPLVVNVEGDCLLCRKCSARENKRTQRQRDSEYKTLKAQRAAGPQTLQEFWRTNRNALSEAERVDHEYRDSEVINFICSINAWLAEESVGDEEGREILRESICEFCDEVSEHGTIETDCVDWQDETRKFQSAADGLFFRCGYYSALPGPVAMNFLHFAENHLHIEIAHSVVDNLRERLRERLETVLAALDGMVYTAQCAGPGCTATATRKLPVAQWVCYRCQAIKCSTPGCSGTIILPPMVRKFVPRGDGNFSLVTENLPVAQVFCDDCMAQRQRAGQAFLSATRNAELEQIRAAGQLRRQPWARPFLTREEKREAERENDRNTVFDDAGRYGG